MIYITQQCLIVVGLGQVRTVSSVLQCQINSHSTHTCRGEQVAEVANYCVRWGREETIGVLLTWLLYFARCLPTHTHHVSSQGLHKCLGSLSEIEPGRPVGACECVYVCVCVCAHACVCMCGCMGACVCVHVCACVCVCVCVCAHACVCMCGCMSACVCMCARVCMRVCVCVCVCVSLVYWCPLFYSHQFTVIITHLLWYSCKCYITKEEKEGDMCMYHTYIHTITLYVCSVCV